jgi:hypothetical protein
MYYVHSKLPQWTEKEYLKQLLYAVPELVVDIVKYIALLLYVNTQINDDVNFIIKNYKSLSIIGGKTKIKKTKKVKKHNKKM